MTRLLSMALLLAVLAGIAGCDWDPQYGAGMDPYERTNNPKAGNMP